MKYPCPVCGKQVRVHTAAGLILGFDWLAPHMRPGTRTPCTGSRCGVNHVATSDSPAPAAPRTR